MPSHQVSRTKLIEFRSVNADRVGVNRWTFEMTGECGGHAGIDATRQIGTNRYIRPQSLLYRLQHYLLEAIHQSARILSRVLVAPIREIHLPIRMLANGGRGAAIVAWNYPQVMPRRQKLHAFETGCWPRQGGECKNMVDTAQVGSRRHQSGS